MSFNAASAITTGSAFTARSLDNTPFASKLKVIYNWLDLEKFNVSIKARDTNHPFQLLFVGTLSYRKGVDLLTPIMRELGTAYHLNMVAGIKNDGIIEMLPNMTMLGRLSDQELVLAYQNCDALLFPSRWEG